LGVNVAGALPFEESGAIQAVRVRVNAK
jgi:hypothetical protein